MNVHRRVLPLATVVGHRLRPLSRQPAFSIPIPQLLKPNPPQPPTLPTQNPSSASPEFTHISKILSNPSLRADSELEEALAASRINPSPNLLLEIFDHFNSTPKPLFTLFNWARNQPDYQFSIAVFNAMVNSLARAREFDSAWTLILGQINGDPNKRPDLDTFRIMIRRYTRAGLTSAAIRTFVYACDLELFRDLSAAENNLLQTLLDTLCTEGNVRVAARYCENYKATRNPNWSPSIEIYNILLNGWFRSRKLKNAERLWKQMKVENVKPTVVTYGTLVEGLCQAGRVDMAMGLLNEMKTEGVKPNAIVYNSIIDALGEAGRFKEALGMLERFSILEVGPTISTYNSLVKGFCKSGDMAGASRVVKMMIDDKFLPSATTYSYFFKRFARFGKTEAGLNLYNKLIKSGYELDRLTYHLLIKMLCEEGKLDLTAQIIKEMQAHGLDLDLATSTMLIQLLWKMHRYDEAVFEFEDMFRRGIVPQHLTYVRMCKDLERLGMMQMAKKIRNLMDSVPRSTKVPNTYRDSRVDSRERKMCIMKRAECMSNALKVCKSPRALVSHGYGPERDVSCAQKLTDKIQRKLRI
ncbi:pentatricopeptide repeat-containing protein [Striga asiatica]|uniref:Pentatricopeptide repeat-containing protein n=1 Tax=Striga asiatica TaxID=4170 RepID=A0A5A7QNH3_STRAF|nr:pentatricopeptide repeat-containing protein [Striga asiatica]